MGLFIIAQRKQPSLIVVHTKELINQWVDAIEKFLHIPADEVGIIGGGKFSIGNKITAALVQSLYRRLDDVVPYVGHIIVDEAHRTPSRVFTQAVDAFPARYRLGLTATPWRRDKLSRVIFWYVGDVTGQIEKADLLDQGNLCPACVRWVETSFSTALDTSEYYSKVLSELTQDLDRNLLIAEAVTRHNGTGISLILSDRREHCETLADILHHRHGIEAAVLTGQTPAKIREQIVRDLQSGKCRHLVATGQLIGEGFDLPGISTLSLATPVKFSGRLIQYVGRSLRPAPGKQEATIIDLWITWNRCSLPPPGIGLMYTGVKGSRRHELFRIYTNRCPARSRRTGRCHVRAWYDGKPGTSKLCTPGVCPWEIDSPKKERRQHDRQNQKRKCENQSSGKNDDAVDEKRITATLSDTNTIQVNLVKTSNHKQDALPQTVPSIA